MDKGDGGCTGEIDCARIGTEEKIERYIAAEQYDKAINLTIIHYHIDVNGACVSYNKKLDRDGYLGNNPDRWTIEVGTGAMTSAGFLAANIYHETVHVQQKREGTDYAGTFLQDEGPQMNEYEAYKKELKWVDANHIQLDETERHHITANVDTFYQMLDPINQKSANNGIYVISPSTVDYPFYPGY